MANNVFTQKEMTVMILNKITTIEKKINETHELAIQTNGKVKLHTKMIFGICGGIIALAGWFITAIFK